MNNRRFVEASQIFRPGIRFKVRRTTRRAFYAQVFISNVGVCTIRRHRHGAEHGYSHTKHADNEHFPRHNQHPTGNNLNSDRYNFHDNRFNRLYGNSTDFPAWSRHDRQSCGDTRDAWGRRQRGICNRRDSGKHPNPDRHLDDCRAVHAFQ